MRTRLCSLVTAASALLLGTFAGTAAAATAPTGPPTAVGTGGAAATVETLATRAAVETLRRGGNAVDAAVTAAAVLGVTEPFSCGIGGGGFLLLRTAGGTVTTVDHRETAPAAMRPDSFWENGAPLPFNAARYSGLSVGVPGTVAGWARALDRYGTISLAEALQPAIRLAREGFVIDQVFFDQTLANVDWFDDVPASAALFLDPDGTPRDVGTVFRNPDLARAYERIAQLGEKGFYRGAIADALTETVQHPPVAPTANHVWRSGLMRMRDLHGYVAPEREPTRVGYRGLDVWGMGPPSSGGSTVGEALNILEGYPLATQTRERQLHLFLEASRFS
ncbi:MAG: gamma-glutamyltransferase, partial [Pseudomonadota bacterium]